MSKDILFLMHHHKDFLFNHNSVWVKPAYTKLKGDWIPSENYENYIDVLDAERNILEFARYYPNQTTKDIIRALGVEASEYYLNYNELEYENLGVSAYGRYLLIYNPKNISEFKITMPPSLDVVKKLSSDLFLETAVEILDKFDLITNFDRYIGCTVEEQYIRHESTEHWYVFKEGIYSLYPEYRKYMDWFTKSEWANFQAPVICKKQIFKKLFTEYFNVMKYVWENVSNVWPEHGNGIAEEFPFRYPGFLNERFTPFFLFANDLKRHNAPLVELRDFNKQVY